MSGEQPLIQTGQVKANREMFENRGTQSQTNRVNQGTLPKICAFPGYEQKESSSIPLVVPNDFEYEAGSTELQKVDETLQRSKLVPRPEALKLLQSIEKPLSVLTACGPARSGKSYILSKILGRSGAFKLGHTFDAQTYGIWMGTHYLDFGEFAMILLDTEGTDAVGAKSGDDISILLLATLLSSCLIYNSKNVPAESDLQTMEWFTRLSSVIVINSMKGRTQESQHSDICHLFPDFLWLLRDVTLALPKNKKTSQPMTPREFMLDVVFKKNKNVGNAIESFAKVDCRILPTPDDASLQGRSPDSLFTKEVQKFIAYIYANARAKKGFHEGGRVDGPALSMLVSSYLEAINDPSAKPCIEKSWHSVVQTRCSQVMGQLVKEYETEMQQKIANKFPMEVAVSDESPEQPSLMQIHGDILRRMLDKLREATKYYMPADSSASETERKELSKQLTDEIIQTEQPKEGSKTTGKVIGGVLYRFMEENEKMSHEHCAKVFGEVSQPVYDCIRRAEKDPTTTDFLKDTMQTEMEQLQVEYSKKSVGPAKEKVFELKLKELEEYGSRIAGFQQKMRDAIDREALAEQHRIEELKAIKAATDEQIKTLVDQQKKIVKDQKEHMERVKNDLETQLNAEKEKVKDLVGKDADMQTLKDSIADLNKKLEDAKKKPEVVTEDPKLKKLEEEEKQLELRLKEQMRKANKNRKINYTKEDKEKIAKVWLEDSPTKAKVRAECERLNLGTLSKGDTKSEEQWINHFADKLLKKKLVTLKNTYKIQDSDIVVHRM